MPLKAENICTTNTPPPGVTLKDASASLIGLDGRLFHFIESLGVMHPLLFGNDAVVTCAVDSVGHKTGKHPIGLAVDLRVNDLPPAWQDRYLLLVLQLCEADDLAVFDERNLPGAPHFHVEVAG